MAQPAFQAAGTKATGTTTASVAWPSHIANDIGLLVIETSSQAATEGTSGWVQLTSSPQDATGSRLTVFWKRAASGGESNATVNVTSGNHICAQIVTFRNCVTSGDPWDLMTGGVMTSAGTTVTLTGITTTRDSTLIVAIVSNSVDSNSAQSSGWTNANLASPAMGEVADVNTNTGDGGGIGTGAGGKATAGATGNTTVTIGSSVSGWIHIALKGTLTFQGAGDIAATSADSGSALLTLVGEGATASASTDAGNGLVTLVAAGGAASESAVAGEAQILVPGSGETASVSSVGGTALVTLIGDGGCASISTVSGEATDTLIAAGATESASSVAGNALEALVGAGTVTASSTVAGDAEVIPGGGTIVQASGDIVCTCTVTGSADLFLTFVTPPQQFTFGGGMTIEQDYKEDFDFLWAEMSEAERQALLDNDDEVVLAATRAFVLCQNA